MWMSPSTLSLYNVLGAIQANRLIEFMAVWDDRNRYGTVEPHMRLYDLYSPQG